MQTFMLNLRSKERGEMVCCCCVCLTGVITGYRKGGLLFGCVTQESLFGTSFPLSSALPPVFSCSSADPRAGLTDGQT